MRQASRWNSALAPPGGCLPLTHWQTEHNFEALSPENQVQPTNKSGKGGTHSHTCALQSSSRQKKNQKTTWKRIIPVWTEKQMLEEEVCRADRWRCSETELWSQKDMLTREVWKISHSILLANKGIINWYQKISVSTGKKLKNIYFSLLLCTTTRVSVRCSYRCFGLGLLGFLHSCLADVQVQPTVLQQPPLLLQSGGSSAPRYTMNHSDKTFATGACICKAVYTYIHTYTPAHTLIYIHIVF